MLRAARAGCRYIRPTAKEGEDEEKDNGEMDDSADFVDPGRSFTARKWSVIPRHVEPPEVEYLAKRRPGLPSLYGATAQNADPADAAANPTPPLRKTKIKRVDPVSGIATVYEVWIPEGHTLEGEVTESGEVGTETSEGIIIAETPAPGTVVEGVGVVNAQGNLVVGVDASMPAKRRPPPPKRKGRGFGSRGRRKKVMFTHAEGAESATAPGAGEGNPPVAGEAQPSQATKDENQEASRMSIDSAAATPDNRASRDGEEEDNEEDEESDEGDEEDEGEGEEGEEFGGDSKPPGDAITSGPSAKPEADEASNLNTEPQPLPEVGHDISEQTARAPSRDMSSSPDLPLAAASANRKISIDRSPVKEMHPQLPRIPAEAATQNLSPPIPAPATDNHLSNQQASDSIDNNNQSPSPPQPETTNTEPEPHDPDAMEGVVHSTPATGLASLPPRPPAPQRSSEPTPPATSTTPVDTAADTKSASAPPVHFDDGEVDLLGSLEASLEKEKGGSKGDEDAAAAATTTAADPTTSAMEEDSKEESKEG